MCIHVLYMILLLLLTCTMLSILYMYQYTQELMNGQIQTHSFSHISEELTALVVCKV